MASTLTAGLMRSLQNDPARRPRVVPAGGFFVVLLEETAVLASPYTGEPLEFAGPRDVVCYFAAKSRNQNPLHWSGLPLWLVQRRVEALAARTRRRPLE